MSLIELPQANSHINPKCNEAASPATAVCTVHESHLTEWSNSVISLFYSGFFAFLNSA